MEAFKRSKNACCASVETGMDGCWPAGIINNELAHGDPSSLTSALKSAEQLCAKCERPALINKAMAKARQSLQQQSG